MVRVIQRHPTGPISAEFSTTFFEVMAEFENDGSDSELDPLERDELKAISMVKRWISHDLTIKKRRMNGI